MPRPASAQAARSTPQTTRNPRHTRIQHGANTREVLLAAGHVGGKIRARGDSSSGFLCFNTKLFMRTCPHALSRRKAECSDDRLASNAYYFAPPAGDRFGLGRGTELVRWQAATGGAALAAGRAAADALLLRGPDRPRRGRERGRAVGRADPAARRG